MVLRERHVISSDCNRPQHCRHQNSSFSAVTRIWWRVSDQGSLCRAPHVCSTLHNSTGHGNSSTEFQHKRRGSDSNCQLAIYRRDQYSPFSRREWKALQALAVMGVGPPECVNLSRALELIPSQESQTLCPSHQEAQFCTTQVLHSGGAECRHGVGSI